MIIKWDRFETINETLQKARSILRELNIPESHPDFVKLRALLNKNTGYLGKFTEWMFKDKVSYERLENLFNRIRETKLSKRIDLFKSPEEIIDSLVKDDSEAAINQMIGAIPSRLRDQLQRFTGNDDCDDCGGDGDVECEECYGSGSRDCPECDGDSTIECDGCNGNCEVECDECDGEGKKGEGDDEEDCPKCDGECTMPCPKCDGEGGKDCSRCDANGRVDCEECEEGRVDCPSCGNKSDSQNIWEKFKSFLGQNKDKKELIIGFLSKKSGRYAEYGSQACKRLMEDITNLLNMSSIDEIKRIALSEPKTTQSIERRDSSGRRITLKEEVPCVKFLYDDEKYLIIAVNYDGIRKFGSSYWCIYNDESTFDEYVKEDGSFIQAILFVRGTTPLFDEKSVMGITMNHKMEISAAHWEDDSDAMMEADEIINGREMDLYDRNHRMVKKGKIGKKLDIPFANILSAYRELYGYSGAELGSLEFESPEIYNVTIDKSLLSERGVNKLFSSYLEYFENNEDSNLDWSDRRDTEFFKNFIEKIKKTGKKFDLDFQVLVKLGLANIAEFKKEWLNINLYKEMGNCHIDWDDDTDSALSIIKFFIKNGYDVSNMIESDRNGNVRNKGLVDLLINNKILDITNFYKNMSWDNSENLTVNNINWILEHDFKFITTNQKLLAYAIRYIIQNDLIDQYRSQIKEILNENSRYIVNVCEILAYDSEDPEISVMAARKILPPKLLQKFKLDISPLNKMEHLRSYRSFRRMNS